MTIDWMNGQISRDALAELADRAARYSPRARQLETFWRDTSLRQIQYFIAVLEDPGAPCQQRQGWLPRLDPPITRQAFMEDSELNIRV